jgi:hypothetical protein
MSRNAKRVRISILNPPHGCQPTTSLEHARRYVRRGTAEWDNGQLRFIHRRVHQAQSPKLEVSGWVPTTVTDSGFSGFLRYPPPMQTSGVRFPALSCAGAGL